MRQAGTAIAHFHQAIEHALPTKQQWVRDQLAGFIRLEGYEPTARELLRWVASQQARPDSVDVNSIRPRLTELEAIGWVAHAGKRVCQVTGATVFTWRLAQPTPPEPYREPVPQLLFAM